MSVNSSSSADVSLLLPHPSSNSSLHLLLDTCFRSRKSIFIFTTFTVTNILVLLPLSTLILYLGFRRRRRQRSAATTSHSDIFTYNVIAMELMEVLGCLLYSAGQYANVPKMMVSGRNMFLISLAMKNQFHMLTCVERYLAVVHPVTYLGLKNKKGVRIRNISIGCVWLMFSVWVCVLSVVRDGIDTTIYSCFSGVAFVVICFCSLSVLRALRRPGPGEAGGDRERADKSKQRAFHTIMTIMGALLLGLGGMLVGNVIYALSLQIHRNLCVALVSVLWFTLPSSLVLPLLFLHREGKLPGCKHNTESGSQ